MNDQKVIQFNATAGSYFVVFLVTAIMAYIPLFGWAFSFNYMNEWLANNSLVNGKKVAYKAGYGETLKFLFINLLLLLITLGIYIFWFAPKSYRYAADHVSYVDGATPAPASFAPPAAPSPPTAPQPPVNPTPPTVVQ
ncbi:MAG TPA: hypothetical protein VN778_02700 [Verrucomicrobiae bacterium]|nr:hypothetical protein [Verrucomicrobiae bacterium]